ncbi:hypothetical protein MMC10_000219 [Thelotrema lepadinum]|nr:hypothetical protein [Thelotrema lepadinum]
MSSRALRLKREEEERKRIAQIEAETQQESDEVEEDDAEDSHTVRAQLKASKNAFDFLDAAEEDEDDELDVDEAETTKKDQDHTSEQAQNTIGSDHATSQKHKKKKAKKKKKTPTQKHVPSEAKSGKGRLDEIDMALQSLSIKGKAGNAQDEQSGPDLELKTFYGLLSSEPKHLNALTEMKKLFGSTVTDSERGNAGSGSGRRRGRGPIELDLGAALAGRNNPVSRGQALAGLALRRNPLMPGKEEWPKATSGGLGMEVVEQAWDFTTEYKIVHSKVYQGVQRQFNICVGSLDPQRMIQHLQLNPYHISTLLQVSEIAKQQGDHSVSVDLLERALFAFGRSMHSSFHNALSEGKARLDFRRPENREFWLTAYRYIGSLGQKGTWRTAFEWAKLLLSLDPEEDPYSMRLVIDQLALRGGQFEHLIKLTNISTSVIDWGQSYPNILISRAMAYHKLKRPEEAQDALGFAMRKFPWIIARLYKELEIDPIPRSVWGRQAPTDREELLSSAYVLRAKDIWNTPEALTLLKSTVESSERVEPPSAISAVEISLNEARHILLSEMTPLIALLPRAITTSRTSSSDPLPPPDDISSYLVEDVADEDEDEWEHGLEADESEQGRRSWFTGMLSRLGVNVNPANLFWADNEFPIDEVTEALERPGAGIDELASRTSRFEELRVRQLAAEERLQDLENDLNDLDEQARALPHFDEAAPAPVIDPAPTTGVQEPTTEAGPVSSSDPPSGSGGYNDEANQRWLAGRGLLRLKEFVAQHGSDENVWKDNLDIDVTPAAEYAHRIMQLQKRASKDFILNYALKQGAGAETSDLIKRLTGA